MSSLFSFFRQLPRYYYNILGFLRSQTCRKVFTAKTYLWSVWYSSAEHHNIDMRRKEDEYFFPYHTTFAIVNVMNFIKNNPFQVAYDVRSIVKHWPQNLSCHDKASRFSINLYISRKEAHIGKRRFKVPEFLIGQGFNRWSVDCSEIIKITLC